MKNHVWRPLIVVLVLVGVLLIARSFIVPKDFGTQEQGFMYGFHRLSNEQEWKNMKVNYKFDINYCKGCHEDKVTMLQSSPHTIIPCEDCHGPAMDHPDNPPKLAIDRSRGLCLRCHAQLPYPTSGRAVIPGIDPDQHNPGVECVSCHNPHNPMEGLQ